MGNHHSTKLRDGNVKLNGPDVKMKHAPKHQHRRRSNTETTTHSSETSRGSNATVPTKWIHENTNVESIYDLHEVIAYGHLGKVRICSRKRARHSNHTGDFVMVNNVITKSDRGSSTCDNSNTNTSSHEHTYHRLYACKQLSRIRMRRQDEHDDESQLLKELEQLHNLPRHVNIATPIQLYTTNHTLWIISELCTGGDLYTGIDTNSELDVANVLEQVADALVWMHSHDITHSNLNMENILYAYAGSHESIKLVDFGISRRYGGSDEIRTACSADYAAAPEVSSWNDSTSSKTGPFPASADVWSMGVIAFILCSGGSFPFGDSDLDVDTGRLHSATVFYGTEWEERGISETGRNFCRNCFHVHPTKRWTTVEALEYATNWVKEVEQTTVNDEAHACPPEPEEQVMDVSLRGAPPGFGLHGEPRKRLLTCLATYQSESQLVELQQEFVKSDSDKSGILTMQQVKTAVKQYCKQQQQTQPCLLTKSNIKEIFRGMHSHRGDVVSNISLEYEPFMEAVLQMKRFIWLENLAEAFDIADVDDSGMIRVDEARHHIMEAGNFDMSVTNRLLDDCETDNRMVEYDTLLQRLSRDATFGMTSEKAQVAVDK